MAGVESIRLFFAFRAETMSKQRSVTPGFLVFVQICPCSDQFCHCFIRICPDLSRFVLSGSFEISEFWDKSGHFRGLSRRKLKTHRFGVGEIYQSIAGASPSRSRKEWGW